MDMGPARNIPGGHPKSGITCYRLLSEIFRQPGYLIRNLNAAESHRSKKREQMGGADNPVNTRGTRRLCYVDCCRFDSWSITLDFGISHLVNSASVYYLLRPPRDVTIRTAAGIAIIVVYFVLLTPLALSYFRSLQVVLTNPGYVPKASPGRPSTTSSSANDRTRHDGQAQRTIETPALDTRKMHLQETDISTAAQSLGVGVLRQQGWNTSTREIFTNARLTGYPDGVRVATAGSLTEVIIAVRSTDVYTRWTIIVLG